MPAYATSGTESFVPNTVLPAALWPGDEIYLFGTATQTPGQIAKANDSNVQFEAVTADERSIAITLAPRPGGGAPPSLMVQVQANASPGAAEIDIQDAAIDADGAYQTSASSAAYKITTWTQEGAVWTAWAQLSPEMGRFVTLLCVANPNSVSFTAKVVYQ